MHDITRCEGWERNVKRAVASHRNHTYHAFKHPLGVLYFGLDMHAVVEGDSKVRTTADENSDGIGVRSVLRKKNCGTLKRVRTTREEASDGAGDVGK